MFLLRLLAVLVIVVTAGSVAAYAMTGDRRFIRFAARAFVAALVIALVVMGLLFAERLLVAVI